MVYVGEVGESDNEILSSLGGNQWFIIYYMRQGKGKWNPSHRIWIEESVFTGAYACVNLLANSTHNFRADLQDRLPEWLLS